MNIITADAANQLFERLRTSFLAVEDALADIIEARAWEPLGYDSLAAAWADRMGDVKLSGASQAYVAFALMDSGASPDEVSDTMKGVGARVAKELYRAHEQGMTPYDASKHISYKSRAVYVPTGGSMVRAHSRRAPQRRNGVTVQGFTDDEMDRWKLAASERGLDFPAWCRDLLRVALNEEVGADV